MVTKAPPQCSLYEKCTFLSYDSVQTIVDIKFLSHMSDCAMTTPPEIALLRARVQELEHLNTDLTRQVADLERHNKELRDAVAALLASDPPPSQASQKQEGRLW